MHFGHSATARFDRRTLGERGTRNHGIQYAVLSMSLIRDARRTMQSENYLSKLLHRRYTRLINSDEGDKGIAACPFELYGKWVNDPDAAREMVESFTRPTAATEDYPIEGLPNERTLHQ